MTGATRDMAIVDIHRTVDGFREMVAARPGRPWLTSPAGSAPLPTEGSGASGEARTPVAEGVSIPERPVAQVHPLEN